MKRAAFSLCVLAMAAGITVFFSKPAHALVALFSREPMGLALFFNSYISSPVVLTHFSIENPLVRIHNELVTGAADISFPREMGPRVGDAPRDKGRDGIWIVSAQWDDIITKKAWRATVKVPVKSLNSSGQSYDLLVIFGPNGELLIGSDKDGPDLSDRVDIVRTCGTRVPSADKNWQNGYYPEMPQVLAYRAANVAKAAKTPFCAAPKGELMSSTGHGITAAIAKALGPVPATAHPVSPAVLRRWAPRLPKALIQIWATYGYAKLAGGRLHLIAPDHLSRLMSYIFDKDPDLSGDTYAIAYGDLGELVLWSQRYGFGFLSPVLSTVYVPNLTGSDIMPLEAQFIKYVLDMPPEAIDAYDPAQQKLHARLKAKLGPLPDGMIYGTTPVPPKLGGTPLDHYVLAEFEDWLEAVYTEISVSLVDGSRPQPQLRQIGSPWPKGMKGNPPQ